MGNPLEIRILVVDPDESFGQRLEAGFAALGGSPSETTPKPIWASSLRECQRFLSDREFSYLAVFVNPKLGHPQWSACIKAAHQFRPGVPVYIVYDDAPIIAPAQLKQLGIQGFGKLPLQYAELVKITRSEIELPASLEPKDEEPPMPAPRPTAPAGLDLKDGDLLAVDLKNRIGSAVSQFDLFIKLSNGRYVQVLKSGDKITQDRLDKYREHGAESLYTLKSQQESYLDFCDQVVATFLKDANVSIEQKTREVSRYGDETVDFLKRAGFTPGSVGRAERFVGKVMAALGQIGVPSPQVREWITQVVMLEHSVGVVTVAGLLLKNIGVVKPETYSAVGIACFLHDIGLLGAPPELFAEDESKMSAEQRKIYREHPITGAHTLAQDKSLPPGVAKAVEQHHMRMSGGFPEAKGVRILSPIAEIIGISEKFCGLMKKAQLDSTLDPMRAIEEIAKRDFSPSIAAGFLKTLKER